MSKSLKLYCLLSILLLNAPSEIKVADPNSAETTSTESIENKKISEKELMELLGNSLFTKNPENHFIQRRSPTDSQIESFYDAISNLRKKIGLDQIPNSGFFYYIQSLLETILTANITEADRPQVDEIIKQIKEMPYAGEFYTTELDIHTLLFKYVSTPAELVKQVKEIAIFNLERFPNIPEYKLTPFINTLKPILEKISIDPKSYTAEDKDLIEKKKNILLLVLHNIKYRFGLINSIADKIEVFASDDYKIPVQVLNLWDETDTPETAKTKIEEEIKALTEQFKALDQIMTTIQQLNIINYLNEKGEFNDKFLQDQEAAKQKLLQQKQQEGLLMQALAKQLGNAQSAAENTDANAGESEQVVDKDDANAVESEDLEGAEEITS